MCLLEEGNPEPSGSNDAAVAGRAKSNLSDTRIHSSGAKAGYGFDGFTQTTAKHGGFARRSNGIARAAVSTQVQLLGHVARSAVVA